MKIEQLPFAQTVLGRRVTQVVRGVVTAAAAARDAYRLQRDASTMQATTLEGEARGLVRRIVSAGMVTRSAPVSPQEHALGSWKPFDALHGVNRATQAALRSREARQAKTTSGAGLEPTAFMPYPEITLPMISGAHRRAWSTGWVDRKADLDMRQHMLDPHVQSAHRIRNAGVFKAPFRILPRSSTPLGLLVAAAVRASWERLDGFRSSMGELGVQARSGFGCAELVWKQTRLSIPVGKRRIAVDSEVIGSLEQVYPRNVAFDVTDDRAYLCMGPGQYVNIAEPGLQKFLFVRAVGDGPTRYRGYGWANAWLSYLGGLSLERFGVVIETFGVATPFLTRDGEGYLTDEEHASAVAILESVGTGQPEVIPARYGTLGHSPIPSNLAPLHGQMLGLIKAEQSKLILSSTLQMEIGGVGSYAAANTHRDQQTDTQIIDGSLYADSIRTQPFLWLCEANAERWAGAFSRYVPSGCTPADVIAECPICEWVISDETPEQRLAVFQGAENLGVEVDPDQVREELGLRAPLPQMFKDSAFTLEGSPMEAAQRDEEEFELTKPPESAEKLRPVIELTPTDLGAIVSVNEARHSRGLPKLEKDGVLDPEGDLTIAAFKAKHDAIIEATVEATKIVAQAEEHHPLPGQP